MEYFPFLSMQDAARLSQKI